MKPQPREVLVIEHNNEDIKQVVTTLAQIDVLGGMRIEVVKDGKEALEYLSCTGLHQDRDSHLLPELVLLSPHLPNLNTTTLLEHMAHDDRTKVIPVILLGALKTTDENDFVNALQIKGRVDKPLNADALTSLVKQIFHVFN